MNNIRNRKYARTFKKSALSTDESDTAEFSISSSAALGILGGTFLVGLVSGKMLGMCRRLWR